MTNATYGEAGLSYGGINWSYDGTELNTGAISPIQTEHGTGYAATLASSGVAVLRSKSGHPAPPSIGVQTATRVSTGTTVSRTGRGAAVSYAKTGHDF